jgi:nitroreductase
MAAMQDFLEVLKTRRTVRSYAAKPVGREDLRELIDLAVLAPTAMNAQPWAFTVVTDQGVMRKLNSIVLDLLRSPEIQRQLDYEGLKKAINEPGFEIFYHAPALIVISGDTRSMASETDCQLAAENLFLSAHAKGLGSCYMGFLVMARENPVVRDLLRIPDGYEIKAAAVIGHPGGPPEGPPMRSPPRIEWVS